MSGKIIEGVAVRVESKYPGETLQQWRLRIAYKILSYLKGQMKRTTIGEERSVPNRTEIYFLFKDELE